MPPNDQWRPPEILPCRRTAVRLTALPPYRLTALPPYRLTALPPHRQAAESAIHLPVLRHVDRGDLVAQAARAAPQSWETLATSTVSLTLMQLAAYSSPSGTRTTSQPRNASCPAISLQASSRRPPSQESPVLSAACLRQLPDIDHARPEAALRPATPPAERHPPHWCDGRRPMKKWSPASHTSPPSTVPGVSDPVQLGKPPAERLAALRSPPRLGWERRGG